MNTGGGCVSEMVCGRGGGAGAFFVVILEKSYIKYGNCMTTSMIDGFYGLPYVKHLLRIMYPRSMHGIFTYIHQKKIQMQVDHRWILWVCCGLPRVLFARWQTLILGCRQKGLAYNHGRRSSNSLGFSNPGNTLILQFNHP